MAVIKDSDKTVIKDIKNEVRRLGTSPGRLLYGSLTACKLLDYHSLW